MRTPLSLLLLFVALSAPAQADEPWLPLADGARWTYEEVVVSGAAGFGVRREGTVVCTSRRRPDGAWALRWTDQRGELDATAAVRTSGGRVEVLSATSRDLLLLPADLDAPRQKAEDLRLVVEGEELVLAERSVGAPETLDLPVGKLEAVPVRSQLRAGPVLVRTTVWYSRGKGVVRAVQRTAVAGAAEVRRELRLVSVAGAAAGPAPAEESPPATANEPPTRPRAGAEPPPRSPQPAGETALDFLRRLARNGYDARSFARLRAATERALDAARRAAAPLPLAQRALFALERLPRKTFSGKHELAGGAQDLALFGRGALDVAGPGNNVLLVVEGDLEVAGALKNALVFVDGDLEVAGGLKDSLVVASGGVEVSGALKDSVVVAQGDLEASGSLAGNLIEARSVDVAGATRENVFVNVAAEDDGRGDRRVRLQPGIYRRWLAP